MIKIKRFNIFPSKTILEKKASSLSKFNIKKDNRMKYLLIPIYFLITGFVLYDVNTIEQDLKQYPLKKESDGKKTTWLRLNLTILEKEILDNNRVFYKFHKDGEWIAHLTMERDNISNITHAFVANRVHPTFMVTDENKDGKFDLISFGDSITYSETFKISGNSIEPYTDAELIRYHKKVNELTLKSFPQELRMRLVPRKRAKKYNKEYDFEYFRYDVKTKNYDRFAVNPKVFQKKVFPKLFNKKLNILSGDNTVTKEGMHSVFGFEIGDRLVKINFLNVKLDKKDEFPFVIANHSRRILFQVQRGRESIHISIEMDDFPNTPE